MAFDIAGALDAGYTPQAIVEHLSQKLKFDSAGAREAGYSDEDIIQHLMLKDAPKPQAGFGSSFVESAKQLLGGKQAATFAYGSPEAQAAARAEMSKPSDRESTSFSDVISGKGKFTDWASQIAGGSAGALAVPAAGSVAAGLMKGPGAAKLVGAGLMGAQYLVGGLDRQAQEQTAAIARGEAPEETSVGKATVAAAGSTALDIVGMKFFSPVFKMFPVVGKLFGAEGDDAARVASTQLVEAYKKGSLTYAGGVAKGVAGGVAFEIPQEIAQTALERWQAGQPLTGEKAYAEYFESAAGALLLGGGLGIAKGGIKTAQDRALVQQAIEEKRAAEEPPETPDVVPEAPDVVPEAPDAASAVPIEKIKNPKTPEEYAQELSRLQAVINNPAETKGHVKGAKARFNMLTAEQIKNAEGAKDAEDTTALDEVAKGAKNATGIPTGKLDDRAATGGVNSVISAATPEVPAGELAPSVGVAVVRDVVGESDAGKEAELAALEAEKAKVEEAARIATALEAEKAKVEEAARIAAALEAEKARAEKLVADIKAKADAEEAARVAAATSNVLKTANEKIDAAITEKRENIKAVEEIAEDTDLQQLVKAEIRKLKTLDDPNDYQNAVDFIVAESDKATIKLSGIPASDIARANKRNKVRSKEDLTGLSLEAIKNPETNEAEYDRHVDYVLTGKGGEAKLRDIGMKDKELAASRARIEKQKGVDAGISGTSVREELNTRYNKLLDSKLTLEKQLASDKEDGYEERTRATQIRLDTAKEDIKKLRAFAKEQKAKLFSVVLSPKRGKGKGMPKDEVEAIRDRVKSKWAAAPGIQVVEDADDLPTNLRKFLETLDSTDAPGIYDTENKVVYLLANNINSAEDAVLTIVHETVGHNGLRTILGKDYTGFMNAAYFNPRIKQAADSYMAENPKITKEIAVEEALAELTTTKFSSVGTLKKLFDRLIAAVRGFLRNISGGVIAEKFTDAEVRHLINKSWKYLKTGEGKGEGEAPTTARLLRSPTRQAPPVISRTVEQMTQGIAGIRDAKPDSKYKKGLARAIRYQATSEGYNSLVRRFQNDRVAIKVLGQFMADAGVLESSGPNANNVFDRITNATGKAQDNVKRYTDYLIRDAQNAILAYAKQNKLPIDTALDRLHLFVMAMHEPERREMKWLRTVPLNNNVVTDSKIVGIMGVGHKAADLRELVYGKLKEKKSKKNPSPKDLRAVVDYLAENHIDKNGFSEGMKNDPTKPMDTDINAAAYNVVGQYLPSEIALLQAEYKKALAANPSLKALATAMKELNKNTIMLDKEANYWSEQVDNYKEFYAYENYVPFKGEKIGENDDNYSQSGGYETALVKNQLGFEGSIKDSTNSIEQMFADANAAAMRAGYVGVTESIKNAMGFNKRDAKGNPLGKQYIKGELIKVIPFEDRDAVLGPNGGDAAYALKSPQNFFHYTTDGTIEVYKIEDKAIQESIRRSWEPSHPFIEALNNLTSTVGGMHTRYNPSFAPMDFIRNSFFNAGIFSADFGLMKGTEYAATVARMVSENGLMKSWKVAQLYEEGGPANMATLKQMAAKDPFVGTLTEWLKAGGRISYVQGMTLRSQQESLRNEVGRSKLVRTKEQFDKWADMWANSFEFTSRAAAYAVAKAEYKARNIAKGMSPAAAEASAIEQATAYAKNLANFEQIGEHGRLAGALFMFFRPAATGAVRALDSLLPAFQNTSTMIDKLPDEIKNDPKAVETYRKEHQAKKKHAKHIMLTMAGSGALIYTMALAMAGEDDEGRNKVAIDNMAQWTRYARLPIPGTDTFIQIPWGFGLGAFASAGAQVAGAAFGKTGWGEMAANLVPVAMDSFIPIPVSRISPIDNPMAFVVDSIFPSIGRPFLEYTMNVDSMGRQIYNNKQTRFGDAYLSGDQVPEIYKDVARWLVNTTAGSTLPLMPADVSPSTLYFFANNYIDGLSRLFLNTPYNLGLVLAGQKDFDVKRDAFVLDSFIGKAANYDAKQFSSTERQIRDMERKINMFKTDPTVYADYLDANPMAKTIVDMFNKQVAQLNKASSISKKLRLDSTLTPKELKEALEDSKLNENAIRRNIVEMFKDYDVHP